MKQCPKGHIYDEKRNPQCPYCNGEGSGFQALGGAQSDFPRTVPIMNNPEEAPFPPTMPLDNQAPPQAPAPAPAFRNPPPNSPGNMSVTIALDQTDDGISPVRGWLVVIDGEKSGLCFNIHGEQNSIGRGQKFDINLSFDKTVSSDGNAVIAYDSNSRKFFLSPVLGRGKNNIYHNDSLLLMPVQLADYDKIKLGDVTYVFRSFCNESFTY